MKKCMLLLLFMFSPFGARAMESDFLSLFSSLCTHIPSWLGGEKVPLSPMQEVQKSKDNFVSKLQISKLSLQYWQPVTGGLFSQRAIEADPVEFIKYCYHQNRHKENDGLFFIDLSDLTQDKSLFNKCKQARIDGYSALGAAIIAEDSLVILNKNMETQYRPHFILRLSNKGFWLTEKDRMLVALHLHDVISVEQKQMMISLLHGHQESDLVLFPHDVRKYIVDYIIHLHKKSYWLCLLLNES